MASTSSAALGAFSLPLPPKDAIVNGLACVGAAAIGLTAALSAANYCADSARRRLGTIPLAGRVVVVTGAGTGIGKAIAEETFRRGAHVVLCGRREAPLQAVASALHSCGRKDSGGVCRSPSGLSGKKHVTFAPETTVFANCDVTNPSDVQRLVDAVKATEKDVALVVLNAGRSCCGEFDESDESLQNAQEMIELNYIANVRLAQLFLPALQHSKGAFLAISSLSGLFPTFRGSAYCGAKHALNGFLDSIGLEQTRRGFGVTCTVSCPGYVVTDVHTSQLNNYGGPPPARDRSKFMTAEYVAAKSLDAAVRRDRRVVMPTLAYVPNWLRSIFPAGVEAIITRGVIASYTDDGTQTLKALASAGK